MKKSYSVLAITCLVAIFTIFIVLTPGYTQEKKKVPPTPTPEDVNPADLPETFNQLQIGMTTTQVKGLLGYPVTIIPKEDKMREWKYYLPGGEARLFLNIKDDNC